jgi:hypothetical protein
MLARRQGNPWGSLLRASFIALVVSISTGCAARSSSPATALGGARQSLPVAPAAAVPWMRSTENTVDVESVASDGLHPDELATLLQQAAFRAGVERIFTARRGPFSRVEARSLAFDSPAGASTYLRWLQIHASELIGDAEPVQSPRLPEDVIFVRHLATGCCHEEVPVYLAAWQRGPFVLSVKASGRGADVSPVATIVRAVDREI